MTAGLDVVLEAVRFDYEEMRMQFDARFDAGKVIAVMGPSGSGKSTLLNLVAGFEQPLSGKLVFNAQDLTDTGPADRPVSMVFQENNLFAHLDVAANVGLGRSPALRLTAADHEAVSQALVRVGLGGKEKRLPRELSGGERQRVALARVLVRDRPVLLLDEPFASLGPALRDDMVDLLAELQKERGMTVLFVTHQPEDAQRIADAVVFLEDGRVTAAGPAREFFGKNAPEAFRRYIGNDAPQPRQMRQPARKPT